MAQVLRYIWQRSDWPSFRFDGPQVAHDLTQARREQGILLGQARALGIAEIDHVINDLWVEDAIATAAIEGEKLQVDSVRSSVMRRLGLKNEGRVERHVEGLVELMHDATSHFAVRLDTDRLCRWQSALFPGGTSGIQRIEVGKFRTSPEPMQIVGGPIGKEVVYYTAPTASRVPAEMRRFLKWFEDKRRARIARIRPTVSYGLPLLTCGLRPSIHLEMETAASVGPSWIARSRRIRVARRAFTASRVS